MYGYIVFLWISISFFIFPFRFEDGTIPFLSIISVLDGYDTIQQLIPAKAIIESMNRISRHCFNLCQYLFKALQHMQYTNGRKVVKLYQDTDFSSIERQGGVISFNIMHDDGSYVGFAEINCMANIHNIIVRTGCFCNPGACQRQLDLTNDEVKKHFQVRNNIKIFMMKFISIGRILKLLNCTRLLWTGVPRLF